ncbi:MAG: MAPEG family protein [Hyphomicrobiales bacterium]|nr:MAPEG family protein [Hyphomicrobiales bacterium]
MPIELKMLVWSCALALVHMLAAVVGAQVQVGIPRLAGNRDDVPALTGFAGRAQRAQRNMLENLVVFAALVLVAQATNRVNATTALGAQLFFWGRLVYAPVYWVGVPWLRTIVWFVSFAGVLMILRQLV